MQRKYVIHVGTAYGCAQKWPDYAHPHERWRHDVYTHIVHVRCIHNISMRSLPTGIVVLPPIVKSRPVRSNL